MKSLVQENKTPNIFWLWLLSVQVFRFQTKHKDQKFGKIVSFYIILLYFCIF